ncbi:MAG: hypothetical protein ACREXX_14050 [Gammaproteobacteria bacterium]
MVRTEPECDRLPADHARFFSKSDLLVRLPEEYDPVNHLPRDCSGIKIIIGLRDRVVPRTDIEELATIAESRGAEVLEHPEFAHPFQDLSLEIHRRRFQEVADFLTRWRP